ncbi:hypothetical protein CAEBREN_05777 [Caenorhabditis brenneri]|uniref:Uncharacterized protein n=1 Tax=Caenorhabditis brenneri TaxID=135651 RepID=G0PGT7_CAEBE|nr:hypothetical protein CAEBREN_05777 [Caenorhabditis brenneri]
MNKTMRSKLQAYDEAANLYINLQHNPERRRIEEAEEQIKNLVNKIMAELEKLRIENNELKQLIEKSKNTKEASTQSDGDVETLLEPPHRLSSGSVQRNRAGPAPENQHEAVNLYINLRQNPERKRIEDVEEQFEIQMERSSCSTHHARPVGSQVCQAVPPTTEGRQESRRVGDSSTRHEQRAILQNRRKKKWTTVEELSRRVKNVQR